MSSLQINHLGPKFCSALECAAVMQSALERAAVMQSALECASVMQSALQ